MIKSEKKDQEKKLSESENASQANNDEKIGKTDLKKEETSEEKLKNTQEKLLRSMAELENQRRRFEKEKQEAFEFGGFNFARESLSLLDNIERATNSFKNDEILKKNMDLEKIIDGIEIINKDLISIFKKNDIEEISCLNKKFDPNFHQAMLEVEDNTKDPGTVVQEIQKGYMMKNRLLRPSLVGVTKKRQEKAENPTIGEEKEQKK
jgi:molecular chaperone GrpE